MATADGGNSAFRWDQAPRWRISAAPEVTIGDRPNDTSHLLFRVGGVARLPDGRIAIANSGTREVRFYDEGGDLLASIGR